MSAKLDCRMLGSRRPERWCQSACRPINGVLRRLARISWWRRQRWRSTVWQSALQIGQWCSWIVRSGARRRLGSGATCRLLERFCMQAVDSVSVVERASPCPQPSARVAASSLRPLTYHSASRPALAHDTQTGELWHLRVFF